MVSPELRMVCIHLESSANMYMVEDIKLSGKLFINSINSSGPRMLPWGIPDNTGKKYEEA